MSLETQVSGLVDTSNSLIDTVNNKLGEIQAGVDAKKAEIDTKKAEVDVKMTDIDTRIAEFNTNDLPDIQLASIGVPHDLGVESVSGSGAGGRVEHIYFGDRQVTYDMGDLINGYWTPSDTDPMKSKWNKFADAGAEIVNGNREPGYKWFYPTQGKLTMLDCRQNLMGSDGHYEDPQFDTVWVKGHFEFVLANRNGLIPPHEWSELIDARLVENGNEVMRTTNGWWSGPETFPIPSVKIHESTDSICAIPEHAEHRDTCHPYSEIWYRYVNTPYNAPADATPAQMGVDAMRSDSHFSLKKLTHYRNFDY